MFNVKAEITSKLKDRADGAKVLTLTISPAAVRFLEGMAMACEEPLGETWGHFERETRDGAGDSWFDPDAFRSRWDWSPEMVMRCGRAFSVAAGEAVTMPLNFRRSGEHDIVFCDGAVVGEFVEGETIPPPPGWTDPDALSASDRQFGGSTNE